MLKVLIVDDDEEFLEETADMISAGGYAVHTAGNASDAIASAEEFDPDVILLDYRMHGNGRSVARAFRESERTRHTPIIIVSSRIENEDRVVLAGEMGIARILEKPVNPLDLIAAIELYELGGGPGAENR